MNEMNRKTPPLLISIVPLIVLMGLLVVNILVFKDDATGGANQIALFLSALYCALIGVRVLKIPYAHLEKEAL